MGRRTGTRAGSRAEPLLSTYHLAHIHDRGCRATPHPWRSRFPQMLLPANSARMVPCCGQGGRQGPRGPGKAAAAAAAGPRLDRRKEGKGEGRRGGGGGRARSRSAHRGRGRRGSAGGRLAEPPGGPRSPATRWRRRGRGRGGGWCGSGRIPGAAAACGPGARRGCDLNNKRSLLPEPRGRDRRAGSEAAGPAGKCVSERECVWARARAGARWGGGIGGTQEVSGEAAAEQRGGGAASRHSSGGRGSARAPPHLASLHKGGIQSRWFASCG